MIFKVITTTIFLFFVSLNMLAMEGQQSHTPNIKKLADAIKFHCDNYLNPRNKQNNNHETHYCGIFSVQATKCLSILETLFSNESPIQNIRSVENMYLTTQFHSAMSYCKENQNDVALHLLKTTIEKIESWREKKKDYSRQQLEKSIRDAIVVLEKGSNPFSRRGRNLKPNFSFEDESADAPPHSPTPSDQYIDKQVKQEDLRKQLIELLNETAEYRRKASLPDSKNTLKFKIYYLASLSKQADFCKEAITKILSTLEPNDTVHFLSTLQNMYLKSESECAQILQKYNNNIYNIDAPKNILQYTLEEVNSWGPHNNSARIQAEKVHNYFDQLSTNPRAHLIKCPRIEDDFEDSAEYNSQTMASSMPNRPQNNLVPLKKRKLERNNTKEKSLLKKRRENDSAAEDDSATASDTENDNNAQSSPTRQEVEYNSASFKSLLKPKNQDKKMDLNYMLN